METRYYKRNSLIVKEKGIACFQLATLLYPPWRRPGEGNNLTGVQCNSEASHVAENERVAWVGLGSLVPHQSGVCFSSYRVSEFEKGYGFC